MSLIGNLSDIQLADVLRLFAGGSKTGRLTVSSEEDQTVLRFAKGALVHAHAAGSGLQGEDAVLDAFGWKEGQLTFVPEEKAVRPNVSRSVADLIADGQRLGDVFHRTTELIPTDRVVFQWAAGPHEGAPKYGVGGTEWRVLRQIDGVRDVREVVEAAGLPRGDVTRVVLEATEAGLLERIEPQRDLRVQAAGLFAKDSAELDERLGAEWRKLHRFGRGVHRVEVRSGTGRSAVLAAHFRPGIGTGVHLPRGVVSELQAKEGDSVQVKPVG
jgi:Domain of unknown function (DUF4388)